jgi:hypothetical protein
MSAHPQEDFRHASPFWKTSRPDYSVDCMFASIPFPIQISSTRAQMTQKKVGELVGAANKEGAMAILWQCGLHGECPEARYAFMCNATT